VIIGLNRRHKCPFDALPALSRSGQALSPRRGLGMAVRDWSCPDSVSRAQRVKGCGIESHPCCEAKNSKAGLRSKNGQPHVLVRDRERVKPGPPTILSCFCTKALKSCRPAGARSLLQAYPHFRLRVRSPQCGLDCFAPSGRLVPWVAKVHLAYARQSCVLFRKRAGRCPDVFGASASLHAVFGRAEAILLFFTRLANAKQQRSRSLTCAPKLCGQPMALTRCSGSGWRVAGEYRLNA
jgi:hypothetical protein